MHPKRTKKIYEQKNLNDEVSLQPGDASIAGRSFHIPGLPPWRRRGQLAERTDSVGASATRHFGRCLNFTFPPHLYSILLTRTLSLSLFLSLFFCESRNLSFKNDHSVIQSSCQSPLAAAAESLSDVLQLSYVPGRISMYHC